MGQSLASFAHSGLWSPDLRFLGAVAVRDKGSAPGKPCSILNKGGSLQISLLCGKRDGEEELNDLCCFFPGTFVVFFTSPQLPHPLPVLCRREPCC